MSNLDFVLNAINETISPKKIILFGSRAKGDSNSGSDIDLAVIQKEKPKLGKISEVLTKLYLSGYSWEVSPDIHLFSEKNYKKRLNNNSLFLREIEKGKVVYEE